MTGKSYGITEMKMIVDYLTENKFYGEIKGRKMWMDFANSQLTTRTWQSLKETFLKRILPDIHNPYYRLSIEQINSFRAGYDVSDKNKNKLEIHTVSDESNDNDQNDTPQSNNDYGIKEEIRAGENIKCSKIPSQNRSSADTVIVDTCYETAEDIQKDLESPGGDKETKSLRDCITYSEPLTPMLQEVLDDFQSEAENDPETSDRENQVETGQTVPDTDDRRTDINKESSEILKENDKVDHDANDISKNTNNISKNANDISKNVNDISKNVNDISKNSNDISKNANDISKNATDIAKNVNNISKTATVSAVALAKEIDKAEVNEAKDKQKETTQTSTCDEKHSEVKDNSPVQEVLETVVEEKQSKNESREVTKSQLVESANVTVSNDSENSDIVVVHDSNSEMIHPSEGLNNSITTPDASLPNNPEALAKETVNEKHLKLAFPKNKTDIKVTRKRSNSEDTAKTTISKKFKLNKKKIKATSETEGKKTIKIIGKLKSESAEPKDKQIETESIPNKTNKINQNETDTNSVDKLEKPSTSHNDDTDKVLLISDTEQSPNLNESSEIKNPCLQNVSLFDEQFNKTKYNTSESEGESSKKKKEATKGKSEDKKVNEVAEEQNEVVMLKSHSESDSEEVPASLKKKTRPGVMSSKTERDRALANVFGFSSGATTSKRRRQLSRRRRTISQNNVTHNNGDSSEWTSDVDSEVYVSPPRSRKNRQTKKYLKPQSGRILSLEEEGGLFVMYDKKIYPLVKDGKLVKNYLTYLPETDSEEERSYWKQKYEEEKRKADELKRLLQKAKDPNSRRSTSSSARPSALRNSTCDHAHPQGSSNATGKEICIPDDNEKQPTPIPTSSDNIKIKFTTKNDREIQLEGNWPQINNVLEHVVHIFHKEPQPISSTRSKTVVEPPSSTGSGLSTPVVISAVQEPGVDSDVHEKVNKIENEIFKEIEERDKEEKGEPNGQESNVTKRKAGRPRKSSQSTSVPQSPAKRLKTSDVSDTKESEKNATNNKLAEETVKDETVEVSKKQLRSPRKNLNESLNNNNNNNTKTVQTRRSKFNTSNPGETKEDEDVRYMFPPKTTRQTVKSTATDKNSKDKSRKSPTKTTKTFSSPDTVCSNSLDSTQGYQDSDPSPLKTEFRKKKMISFSEMKYKTISRLRRSRRIKSYAHLCYDGGESSNSSPGKTGAPENSSLNSNIYKSESYQLLTQGARKTFRQLDPIDEINPVENEVQFIKHLDSNSKNECLSAAEANNTGQIDSDFGSSSNISLPLSPELSVVESLSVSKELVKTIEDVPTINEIQRNEAITMPTTCNQYLISDIDVSVPLMEQDCGLEGFNVVPTNNINKTNNLVTESLLTKIGTINIADQTNLTDTLDVKLRDLLLESAKKISNENDMDVDEINTQVQKKTKNKKRCSTPRKRKNSTKSKKVPNVQTVEEEHIESFAKGGRQSCPPIMQAVMSDEQEINIASLTIDEQVKTRGRRKKDIIKVKIVRPKSKKIQNDTTTSVQNSSKKSVCTDSGINDTESGVFLRGDESVELIHNHSETCLQANDCIGDSLEFVENSIKSILTLDDSMQSADDILWHSQCELVDAQNIVPDLFCNDAQDVKSFYDPKPDDTDTCQAVFHSPVGTESSLITEDLSDDLPQSHVKGDKWYLLSEDETTNTNMNAPNVFETPVNVASFGANLKQIFPLVCAVPDLSTITEMSRESDNSRRLALEGATGDGFDSQTIFD